MKIKRGVRRAPVSFTELTLPSLIAVAILALAGCSAGAGGGGNGNNITVTINNKVTSVQAGTAAISFSATVQNDSSNRGSPGASRPVARAVLPLAALYPQRLRRV